MSRRAAEEAILAGRVTVNGNAAALGSKADPSVDRILLDGKKLPDVRQKVYLMLNKPRGYVTTLSDEKGRKNVASLLRGLETRVYPVGRLDLNSEGLLLFTNDGDFANRVMHPSHEISKTYLTWVRGEDPEAGAEFLRQPMEIDAYMIQPAQVEVVYCNQDSATLSITIREGRNRQIRKMCEKAGLRVTRLVRVAEGGLQLGSLKTGCWRHLRQEEIEMLLDGQGNRT